MKSFSYYAKLAEQHAEKQNQNSTPEPKKEPSELEPDREELRDYQRQLFS